MVADDHSATTGARPSPTRFLFVIAAIVIGFLMLKSPDFATAVQGVIAVLVVIFIITAIAASCS